MSRFRRPSIGSVLVGLGMAGACLALVATLAVGPAASATEGPEIVVSDATVGDPADGEPGIHRVALTDAPNGLAGFTLELELESAGVATVSDASYPEQFGITTDPVVSADERSVTLEAVDLDDAVTDGAANVTLARVAVTGVAPGETELRVSNAQVDADGGSAVDPTLGAGTVTVGEPATDSDATDPGSEGTPANSSGAGSESGDTDSEPVPGFTGLLALAVALGVVVAVVALVPGTRRR
ncbi:hypothetical protein CHINAEXTREME_01860 [Halobiforma lacisalsi AJ5]|uniref:Cell surface protein n=1 Tax=Natronobacterium lacisalsi AJ5 TaxID=358396 RepID=M0LGB5_NATLA|nr:hypothetical protein [Halobiforma lacisalsi]APW99982.1 hypothetical protein CHINAEXTREME_01860 [Halobiforma lacisalsi AJ5]EMA32128.1 hypothetical protein C445_12476 [Halobiforma lacisalsi AJ5]